MKMSKRKREKSFEYFIKDIPSWSIFFIKIFSKNGFKIKIELKMESKIGNFFENISLEIFKKNC